MNNAVILDFMGVVADFNYLKLGLDLTLKEKFSTLRVFLMLAKIPKLKQALHLYKCGEINKGELEKIVADFCPNSSYVIPVLLDKIKNYLEVNYEVIEYAEKIRSKGCKVFVLSNTIPETEAVINNLDLSNACDGIVCSTQVHMAKPNYEIYDYIISKYNLNPSQTVFIDDSKKNLAAAEKLGIQTIKSSNTSETCSILDSYLSYLHLITQQDESSTTNFTI